VLVFSVQVITAVCRRCADYRRNASARCPSRPAVTSAVCLLMS